MKGEITMKNTNWNVKVEMDVTDLFLLLKEAATKGLTTDTTDWPNVQRVANAINIAAEIAEGFIASTKE